MKFKGCGNVLIPGDEKTLSIRLADEEPAALKWVESCGAYTLETYRPGETKIILSYYGVEKSFPLTVKGGTVEQICYWDAEDTMIEQEMDISLPRPGTGYDLPLAAVMSDGSRVSLARQYVTTWENSDFEVADCGVDCTVYAKSRVPVISPAPPFIARLRSMSPWGTENKNRQRGRPAGDAHDRAQPDRRRGAAVAAASAAAVTTNV